MPDETNPGAETDVSRAQARIQALLAENATLKQTNQTLTAQVQTVTSERTAAQTALQQAQGTHARQLASAQAGLRNEADMRAAEALHSVYGGSTPFADWIAQPRDKLPAAVQSLLGTATTATTPAAAAATTATTAAAAATTATAAAAAATTATTATAATTAATTPAVDAGASAPAAVKKYTPEQLKEISEGGPLFKQLVKEHGSYEKAWAAFEAASSAA